MFYHARFYDPALGTFISPDTMVPQPGVVFDYNRFMYVRGNALKYNDPSGHWVSTVVGGLIGGAANAGVYLWSESRQDGIDLHVSIRIQNGLKVDFGEDWGDATVAFGEGAVAGALIGTPGTSSYGISMATNMLSDHVGNLMTGEDFSAGKHVVTGLSGAAQTWVGGNVVDAFVSANFLKSGSIVARFGQALNAGLWGGVDGYLGAATSGGADWRDGARGVVTNSLQEAMTARWLGAIASEYGDDIAREIATELYTNLVSAGVIEGAFSLPDFVNQTLGASAGVE